MPLFAMNAIKRIIVRGGEECQHGTPTEGLSRRRAAGLPDCLARTARRVRYNRAKVRGGAGQRGRGRGVGQEHPGAAGAGAAASDKVEMIQDQGGECDQSDKVSGHNARSEIARHYKNCQVMQLDRRGDAGGKRCRRTQAGLEGQHWTQSDPACRCSGRRLRRRTQSSQRWSRCELHQS